MRWAGPRREAARVCGRWCEWSEERPVHAAWRLHFAACSVGPRAPVLSRRGPPLRDTAADSVRPEGGLLVCRRACAVGGCRVPPAAATPATPALYPLTLRQAARQVLQPRCQQVDSPPLPPRLRDDEGSQLAKAGDLRGTAIHDGLLLCLHNTPLLCGCCGRGLRCACRKPRLADGTADKSGLPLEPPAPHTWRHRRLLRQRECPCKGAHVRCAPACGRRRWVAQQAGQCRALAAAAARAVVRPLALGRVAGVTKPEIAPLAPLRDPAQRRTRLRRVLHKETRDQPSPRHLTHAAVPIAPRVKAEAALTQATSEGSELLRSDTAQQAKGLLLGYPKRYAELQRGVEGRSGGAAEAKDVRRVRHRRCSAH